MASPTLEINRLDIVATQGEYLLPRAPTPVFEKPYDEEFATKLAQALSSLVDVVQRVRRVIYHEAADEWPIGYTPPEVKERRRAELRALEALQGSSSSAGSDIDEDDDATADGGVQIDRFDIVATQGKYLIQRARTPVFEKAYDEEFATKLARELKALINIVQKVRRAKYHAAADEWPIGHTPPE
ncbi:MAG: hypothetical protein Q9196_005543, partial [Gyalolechia fulgens]